MKKKEILIANNDLLAAICEKLDIPTTQDRSIGGGGVSRPTGNGDG